MKVRVIELEGESAEVMAALERLLAQDAEGVQLAEYVPPAQDAQPAPRDSNHCRCCGNAYWSRAHREGCQGLVLPPSRPGCCRKCGHSGNSQIHKEQCRGGGAAPPRAPTRCPRCKGSVLNDHGEPTCINCGWSPAVVRQGTDGGAGRRCRG